MEGDGSWAEQGPWGKYSIARGFWETGWLDSKQGLEGVVREEGKWQQRMEEAPGWDGVASKP